MQGMEVQLHLPSICRCLLHTTSERADRKCLETNVFQELRLASQTTHCAEARTQLKEITFYCVGSEWKYRRALSERESRPSIEGEARGED